jgi:dienelactone hydrolase
MSKHCLIFIIFCFPSFCSIQAQNYPWSNLKSGPFKVQLAKEVYVDSSGDSAVIYLWQPVRKVEGPSLSMKDLILSPPDLNKDTAQLISLKKTIERIYNRALDPNFFNSLNAKTQTYLGTIIESKKKYPVVIALGNSSTYFDTFEYLCSRGFIVAVIRVRFAEEPPSPDGPFHYKHQTDQLENLLKHLIDNPAVDTSQINAFGHGGGIQAALYLAMRTNKIKRVVNFDGGFFGPRSKTTNSSDYQPQMLKTKLLHVVTPSQDKQDDINQIDAIKKQIVKVTLKTENLRHHDFTILGHIYHSLIKDARDDISREIYSDVHEMAVAFLRDKLKTSETSFIKVEVMH